MTTSSTPSRHDPYRNIHKGLRAAMFDAVYRIGSTDLDNDDALHATLHQAGRVVAMMAAHVKHENNFMHPAIEARLPGGSQTTADDHLDHQVELVALGEDIDAVRVAPASMRAKLMHRLYQRFTAFTAENLEHMLREETHNNELLWKLYPEEALVDIHDRLVAAIEPPMLMEMLGWMAHAMAPRELAQLLADIRDKAGSDVFGAVAAMARERLGMQRWFRVAALLTDADARTASA